MPVPCRTTAPTHLLTALAAGLVVAGLLAAMDLLAGAALKRFGPALAALNLPEEARGVVLQSQLFERRQCLPIYGSSELSIDQPTRPDLFFRRKRQGFDVGLVGHAGNRCLFILQELASLGETVRGKNVVVFLSPTWFLPAPGAARQHSFRVHEQFASIFSPLQTGRVLVAGALDPALKRQLAARLLAYDPVIQTRSPLVDTALASLQAPTWTRRCLFAALRPLLELQNRVLILQERWHWLELIRDRAALPAPSSPYQLRRKRLEWNQLDRDVDHGEAKHTETTFYSRGPSLASAPDLRRAELLANQPDRDEDFLRRMEAAPEWEDLELLLKAARELGVRLLLVEQPINGLLSDSHGVTAPARREFYRRMSRTAAAYRVPLRDFSAFEENRDFFMDILHPSAEAWVHYDQTLEEFYGRKTF